MKITRPNSPFLDSVLGEEYKVLDKGFVRVIDYMGIESSVVEAARKSNGGAFSTTERDNKLLSYLYKHRHTSPFEMCEIKLHIKLPIFVARQWLRHRTASVNEFSGRYAELKDEFYFPDVIKGQDDKNKQSSAGVIEDSEDIRAAIRLQSENSYGIYQALLGEGVSREQARIILPLNTYTDMYWKVNLHNLLHFLKLRTDKAAQDEITCYANLILHTIVKGWVPYIYELFLNYSKHAVTLADSDVADLEELLSHILWENEISDDIKEISKRLSLTLNR